MYNLINSLIIFSGQIAHLLEFFLIMANLEFLFFYC